MHYFASPGDFFALDRQEVAAVIKNTSGEEKDLLLPKQL
jgi:hypothetical protein